MEGDMRWVEDVPEHLADAEFGDQPSGAMAAVAFVVMLGVLCGSCVAVLALMA